MNSAKMIVVQTTVGSKEDADRLVTEVMAKHLAACCQQLSITSTYWWEGQLQTMAEILLSFKTVDDAWDKLEQTLTQAHPYDCPEIISLPVRIATDSYADWVAENTLI
ncbi:MAG: divalent-cation tolerance protein CutA [bacterium]